MSLRLFHSQNKSAIDFTNANLVFDGNSLTNYGAPCFPGESYGSGDKYPTQLAALSPWNSNGATVTNRATSGQTTAQMISGGACDMNGSGTRGSASSEIDVLLGSNENIIVVWEGTNDLYFNGNTTDAYNRLVTYCQDRQTAGWRVVILTILYRSFGGNTPAGDSNAVYNGKIDTVNASIRSNWATFADAICDVAANANLDDPTDATYFFDGTHLTGTGRGLIASLVSSTILGL